MLLFVVSYCVVFTFCSQTGLCNKSTFHFCFVDMILVLIVPVAGYCWFILLMDNLTYNYNDVSQS